MKKLRDKWRRQLSFEGPSTSAVQYSLPNRQTNRSYSVSVPGICIDGTESGNEDFEFGRTWQGPGSPIIVSA